MRVSVKPPDVRHLSGRELFAGGMPLLAQPEAVRSHTESVHDHDFVEAMFVIAGHGVHWSQTGERRIGEGDVLLIAPGAWHAFQGDRDLLIYNCCFGRELLNFATSPSRATLWPRDVLQGTLHHDALQTCRAHLDAIHDLAPFDHDLAERVHSGFLARLTTAERALNVSVQRRNAHVNSSIRLKLVGHLLLLLGEVSALIEREADSAERLEPHVQRWTERAARLLEEHPTHAWTLAELASRLHLSPSYLSRVFKAGTGDAPMAYLARLRVENAAQLLRDSDLPVGDVGVQVGWPDPSYFSERFRAHFGIPPRDYRAQFLASR